MVVGHDNKIRSVKVKRGDGLVVHHSINHLYPLELSLTHSYNDSAKVGVGLPKENFEDANVDNGEMEADNLPSDLSDPEPRSSVIDSNVEVTLSEDAMRMRPKRTAAKACVDRMREWCQTLRE